MMQATFITTSGLFALSGTLSVFLYLRLLAWNVRALSGQAGGLLAASALMARAALMLGVLSFAATHGAAALISAFAGFLLSRAILLRRPERFVR